MAEASEEVRQRLISALEDGRVEFAPGFEEAVEAVNWERPDFTVTKTQVVGCWGPNAFTKGGFEVRWATSSAGFGSLAFYLKDGKLCCENEGMGRAFIKKVLADLVDRVTLADDEPDGDG